MSGGNIGKGVVYIVVLAVCTFVLIKYLSNPAFVHIPVFGNVRKIVLAVGGNGYFMLGLTAFIYFVCPGWLLSQIIFKGNNEARNFIVYTSAPLIIIIIFLFIGYLISDDSGSFLSAQAILRDFIEMVAIFGGPVIVVAILAISLPKWFSKRAVNTVMGVLFVVGLLLYVFLL